MDKVQTQGKIAKVLRSQGLCVETDCGDIEVIPYDDGIANGIKIFLGDTLVAMVDCYRKSVFNLPKNIKDIVLDFEEDKNEDEVITDYLSDTYGFCVNDCKFSIDKTIKPNKVSVWDIEWDTSGEDEPEARLLVYGPESPESDEPQQVITLN